METQSIEEKIIVEKAIAGDPSAQTLLFRKYGSWMFNICLRITGDKNTAEDILQDSFVIAFTKLTQLREKDHFGGWLKAIVINECIRISKKAIRWSHLDFEVQDIAEDEEQEWWQTISLEHIHHEIKRLPDGCRIVFCLFVLEDFSHGEIAKRLGISESTSKTQYRRARQLLKERIVKQIGTYGQI